tara:strand:+ start:350 stop:742 length:393 start_codon:yes stop_codon:yes gene_type:complete
MTENMDLWHALDLYERASDEVKKQVFDAIYTEFFSPHAEKSVNVSDFALESVRKAKRKIVEKEKEEAGHGGDQNHYYGVFKVVKEDVLSNLKDCAYRDYLLSEFYKAYLNGADSSEDTVHSRLVFTRGFI